MASLMNPLSMFDVSGKVALITGASGAFGAVAARMLGGAGCRLVLAAGKAAELAAIAQECRDGGADVTRSTRGPTPRRPARRWWRRRSRPIGRLDILVVASGMNKVAKIDDMPPETFAAVMDANVTQSWLLARAATVQMKAQGGGGKIVLVSSARGSAGPSGGLHRLLRRRRPQWTA